MKKAKYRKVDSLTVNSSDNNLIREYMEDEREGVKYHESWSELMGILEVMEQEVGWFEFTRNSIKIHTKYRTFGSTYMYHDYRTRKQITHKVIIEALKWHMSEDKSTLDRFISEGIIEIAKKK